MCLPKLCIFEAKIIELLRLMVFGYVGRSWFMTVTNEVPLERGITWNSR